MGTGSFPGVKCTGRGVDHPPLSSAEVEGRVELYICSTSGASWPVLGWPLPLLYLYRIKMEAVQAYFIVTDYPRIISRLIDWFVFISNSLFQFSLQILWYLLTLRLYGRGGVLFCSTFSTFNTKKNLCKITSCVLSKPELPDMHWIC